MSGILPTIVYASTVADLQARLSAAANATDLSVQSCPSLPDSTRAAWGIFYSAVITFCKQSPSWWDAAAMTNQAETYGTELFAWQQKLTAIGCSSANPVFDPGASTASQSATTNLLQWGMYAVIAVAGAYGLGKIVSIIPKPQPRQLTSGAKENGGGSLKWWRIYNIETGTDLGEYQAATRREALRMFLADTDDKRLDRSVRAEPA